VLNKIALMVIGYLTAKTKSKEKTFITNDN
jgi:hypothetical protein